MDVGADVNPGPLVAETDDRSPEAGLSDWATTTRFYISVVSTGVALSDHREFEELVGLVEAVDSEAVCTQHGSADPFADHPVTGHGYDTTALERTQSTLGDC